MPPLESALGPVNPSMLVVARESRGWTQAELADAIGISQSKLSKFELGLMTPDTGEMAVIADKLRYEIDLLTQTEPLHAVGASLLYRQKSQVPQKQVKRIQAEINIRKMQISRLLKAARVDEHLFPSIPPESMNGNVEAVAREIRRAWQMPLGPVHDLTRLIESKGGIVVQMDFGTNLIDGAHLWVPGLPPMFFMSTDVPGERYRFSLAHELGHAILHRAVGFGEIEEEADRFASEFLMPGEMIRSDLRNFDLEVARRLKGFWKASMQAIIERAFQLKAISQLRRRRLWAQISAQGGRTNEPWPLPLEKASQFDNLVKFHYESLRLSNDDVRRIMFTDRLGSIPVPEATKLKLVGEGMLFNQSSASSEPSQPFLRLPDAGQERVS